MSGSKAAEPLNAWNPAGIDDFAFTDQQGRPVTKRDLLGQPWVAAFVFTQCAGPCPRITAAMKLLQDKLAGRAVRFVTFTVDPKNDTQEVLARYAANHDADPERWFFLRGDQREIYQLIQKSFLMPVHEEQGERRQPGFEVLHSTNLMLVDAEGRVLAKYNGANEEDVVRLRQRLEQMVP